MAEQLDLKKMSRTDLLELMIRYSEEAQQAREREENTRLACEQEKAALREQFSKEIATLQEQMAQERARMTDGFDLEREEMRYKFSLQKEMMQAKFDKDIAGLKERLAREKAQMQRSVDLQMMALTESGNIAELSLALQDVFVNAQKAADQFVQKVKSGVLLEDPEIKEEIVGMWNKAHDELEQTRAECAQMLESTREECERMKAEANNKQENAQDPDDSGVVARTDEQEEDSGTASGSGTAEDRAGA
ncbi:MAG: hypothetical protein K6A92_11790 [Lachnospiraceae bacterium]|nr:hypothetical protein [Lachnospiraceae bacterium]